MDGRGARNKGARGEREIVERLTAAGIPAIKISRSGYTGPDVMVMGEPAEVKRHETTVGIKNYQWLEGVRYLFMRRNKMPWLVVMRLEDFEELARDSR